MRYLLTGATGFVGANVARHLLARGDEVVCVVRTPNLCVEGLPLTLTHVDLLDADGLARALDGADGVFHVAGSFDPGPDGEASMRRIHVDATTALLRAMSRARVPRMVLCSSSVTVGWGPRDAPGDEDTPVDVERVYGRDGALRVYHDTKLESERRVREAGHVVVNPDYVVGAWDVKPTSGQLVVMVARGWMPFYPPGGKCFVDADDCAAAHLGAMDRGVPGRRYLLGNHNASYREFMGLCATAAGRRPPPLRLPRLGVRVAAGVGRVLRRVDGHRFAGLEPHILAAMREERYRSGRRAREELGMPATPLAVTVEKALSWFRAHGYV